MAIAKRAAVAEELDEAVVCAVVEQESGWNTWAIRYEPAILRQICGPAVHQQDNALHVAKGGSTLQRVTRVAKWFLVGAAAGALAARMAH